MSEVVGIRFKEVGKIYYFDPIGFKLNKGDRAIVETIRGLECGEVAQANKDVNDDEIVKPLKPIVRVATAEDLKVVERNKKKEKEAFDICLKKIALHGLDMKLIDVEYTFDNNKVLFYFTADGRVDFRELVKSLAAVFRTRIELRQIGVRDETKILGGMGICGRVLCCHSFLSEFAPVSIKMAKEQNLSLNPTKISGICGRLMCCLEYENEPYSEAYKKMPKVGSEVTTPDGKSTVISNNMLKMTVKTRAAQKDGTLVYKDYDLKDVKFNKQKKVEKDDDESEISD